jgi:hypothetical protein
VSHINLPQLPHKCVLSVTAFFPSPRPLPAQTFLRGDGIDYVLSPVSGYMDVKKCIEEGGDSVSNAIMVAAWGWGLSSPRISLSSESVVGALFSPVGRFAQPSLVFPPFPHLIPAAAAHRRDVELRW